MNNSITLESYKIYGIILGIIASLLGPQVGAQGGLDFTKLKLPSDTSSQSFNEEEVTDADSAKVDTASTLRAMDDGELNYGYLSLTIFPGFKSIRLDRETTVGLSDMILIPAGGHWLEITSPEGYADTSFKVLVKTGEVLKKEVQLRNLLTGEYATAPMVPEKPGLNWKKIGKITAFSLGALAAVIALNEERLARKTSRDYNSNQIRDEKEWDKLYNDLEDHIRKRNAAGLLSILSLGVGVVLWRF